MIRKPNLFQKLLHRVIVLRPITVFFAPRIHSLDQLVFKWTENKHTLSEILGWPIIQLTTTGAKTNQPRTMPLVAVFDGKKIALIASNFGREHNPGWYYNLKVHPVCEVQLSGCSTKYIAHEAMGEEYQRYWKIALSLYAGYDKYKERAAPRHIPVIVLEPQS